MVEGIGSGFFYAAVIAFGLVVGSFLNVVIFRLPRGESIVFPGSHCPACGSAVKPWDNLPVVSYVFLRGRCRSCQSSISLRYPAVELATGLLFGAVAWLFGPTWLSGVMMVFVAGLLVAALVDLDHQIIPDSISMGGCVFGLIFVPLANLQQGIPFSSSLLSSVLGAFVGGGTLWGVAFLHARLSVALGREYPHWPGEGESVPKPLEADYWLWFPGLGLGDIKLLAMIGAFLGPWGALDTVVSASLIGLVAGGLWGLIQRNLNAPFGFGPAIACGAVLSLFFPLHLYWLGVAA
ncbi:MAG: prepilin peptidase [Myxococcota bacterium]|nr:prepilin peptidase [Myxococcota bacterium]